MEMAIVGVLSAALVVALGALIRLWRAARRADPADPPPAQSCETCKHFDLEEGQAVLQRTNPVFANVMAAVSPQAMGRAQFDENGDPIEAGTVPAKARWEQFGACGELNRIIWKADGQTCEHYAYLVPAEQLVRSQAKS